MIQRCTNPRAGGFRVYGGRGISVCDRWLHSFENFLADMGSKPSPHHSLDRIEGDADYEPGNCRWATAKEQANNISTNVRLTVFGETKTMSEWSDTTGVKRGTIWWRVRHGWSSERAVWTGAPVKHLDLPWASDRAGVMEG
jgi:hypothetical protein